MLSNHEKQELMGLPGKVRDLEKANAETQKYNKILQTIIDKIRNSLSGLRIDGNLIVDHTDEEALLVRKNSDSGDVLVVDTANEDVEVKKLKFADGGSTVDIVRDEDNMSSDDAAALATQQSIKKYVDDNAGGAGVSVNVETLSDDKTLTDSSDAFQVLDPGDSNRDVNLPDEGGNNPVFWILNSGDGGETISVKRSATYGVEVANNKLARIVPNQSDDWWYDITTVAVLAQIGYSHYASVTIQNGKVADDHANFTIPVYGTFDGTGGEADLRTTANGGNIQNTDAAGGANGATTVPADFVFSPNTNGSSPYNFEIEKYNATTGEIVAWVEIPTMDADADLTFYMSYGNSSITSSQESVNDTWNSGYKMIHNLNGAAYTSCDDSTSNGNDISEQGGDPSYQQAGPFGYAVVLDGVADALRVAHSDDFAVDDFTLEIYTNPAGSNQFLLQHVDATSNDGFAFTIGSDSKWNFYVYVASTTKICTSDDAESGGWDYLAGVRNSGDMTLYVDGVAQADTETNAGAIDSNAKIHIGESTSGAYDYNGAFAFIRFSNVARPANWLLTTSNSLDASTFLVFGNETAA